MFLKRNLYIAISTISFFIVMAIESTNVLSRDRTPKMEYEEKKLREKFERLKTYTERVERLKKRGYMPKAIEAAKEAIEIAKKEFGPTSLTVIKPLLALAELQGGKSRFEEADRSFEQVYAITALGDDATVVYGIAYRVWIARLYLQWNKFEKAESILLETQQIIRASDHNFESYTQTIKTELEKIEELKEANRFRIKKK